jgi:hypothetical protein
LHAQPIRKERSSQVNGRDDGWKTPEIRGAWLDVCHEAIGDHHMR